MKFRLLNLSSLFQETQFLKKNIIENLWFIVAGVGLLQLLHGLHNINGRTAVALLSLLSPGGPTLGALQKLDHGLVQSVGLRHVVLVVSPLHATVHFLQQLICLYHVATGLVGLPDPGCLQLGLGQGVKHLPGSPGELVGLAGHFGQLM